jgi:glutathione S-transferase
MKLYYKAGSCSLSIRIAIHEMGLACDFEAVDLISKKTETGMDYFTINPKGSVPALALENGEIITEGVVIQQYLADTHKATHLLPAVGQIERYHVLEWLNVVSMDLHKACVPLFPFITSIPEALKKTVFKHNLEKILNIIEKQLSEHTYLVGEYVSIADFYLFTVLRWIPSLGPKLSDWPFITHYFSTMQERKAVQQALKEEGLEIGSTGGACGVK